ncbi:MAG: GGDEF domain-containing phosphodiesterase [Lysobacterales bacterium]
MKGAARSTSDSSAVPTEQLALELAGERERRQRAESASESTTARLHREFKALELARAISEIANSATSLAEATQAVFAVLFAATTWRTGFLWRAFDDGRWERLGAERGEQAQVIEFESTPQNQLPDYLTRLRGGQRTAVFEDTTMSALHPDVQRQVSTAVIRGATGIDGYVELWSDAPEDIAESAFDILRHVAVQLGHLLRREQTSDAREGLRERDALTGMLNRVGLVSSLAVCDEPAPSTTGGPSALVVADIVDFSACNDLMGQGTADRLLVEAGRRIAAEVPAEYPVARISANTFAFPIVTGRDEVLEDGELQLASERVLAAADIAFGADRGVVGRFEFRIGIARCEPGVRASDLLARAETALRVAKKDGVRARMFEPAMTQQAGRAAQLRFALAQALERDEFTVVHQPLVNLADGRIVGAEALLRWHSPDHGSVACVEMVPMLEESGLIREIGAWVLDQALATAVQMRKLTDGNWVHAINASAIQFQDRDFGTKVAQALARHDYPGSALEIEITESVLLQPTPRVHANLHLLNGLGVRMSLDDFGTGFSAMSYLRTFDMDRLKIDRSFVTNQSADPRADRLVTCIVAIARALHMDVIGEGVESYADLDFLRRNGCELGQGFGLAQPMPTLALFDLVRGGTRLRPSA